MKIRGNGSRQADRRGRRSPIWGQSPNTPFCLTRKMSESPILSLSQHLPLAKRVSFSICHTKRRIIDEKPAFLIETAGGSYIWECSAFLSLGLIGHLSELKKPLKAMAISHPHVDGTFVKSIRSSADCGLSVLLLIFDVVTCPQHSTLHLCR